MSRLARRSFAVVLPLVAAVAGCGSSKDSAMCSDVVLTPAGPRSKACVHEVPNGAVVMPGDGGASVVVLNGNVIATYPPCPCPAPMCTDRNGVAHASGLPWTDGCQVCSCGDTGDGKLSAICSHNGCPMDASTEISLDASDSGDASSCPGPIAADAGVTTLDDLPIQSLCAVSPGRLIRWVTSCAGSIIVVRGEGVDCASYWLFDATTRTLQATARGCNRGPSCTGSTAGFRFPDECFDGNFITDVVKLCPASDADAGVDMTASPSDQ